LVFARTANGSDSVAPIDLMNVFFIFWGCSRTQPFRGACDPGL
jgi:hypothetical protein